ncbi:hypothetical protein [Neobacillus niacini]|uniref:hypothetical protein n=1 Tax=Neobacillus niacini TaxID=86668 RepID=UPI00286063BC|nr:hypothetical protein [Neobacillus niacini]MDR6998169.1 hydroxymethylpyrimidine pyrophosphatase-like HAD family hydrolase [Neobacillus niacini]
MIIASDLDRTLVYSKRAIEQLGAPQGTLLRPVEEKDGNPLAYMTVTAYHALIELCRNCLFIPVTTRTTAQYNRFTIFEKEISLPYAVTFNGAVILYKGEALPDWSKHILSQIQSESASHAELQAGLKRGGFHFNGRLKTAENLFYYYLLESSPTLSEQQSLSETVSSYGWRVSLQGRKLYLIPNAINKGAALQFICNREGLQALAGAGDSVLDWDFLQSCQNRFVPTHGELALVGPNIDVTYTTRAGVLAGEEIVQHFLTILEHSFKNKEVNASK